MLFFYFCGSNFRLEVFKCLFRPSMFLSVSGLMLQFADGLNSRWTISYFRLKSLTLIFSHLPEQVYFTMTITCAVKLQNMTSRSGPALLKRPFRFSAFRSSLGPGSTSTTWPRPWSRRTCSRTWLRGRWSQGSVSGLLLFNQYLTHQQDCSSCYPISGCMVHTRKLSHSKFQNKVVVHLNRDIAR